MSLLTTRGAATAGPARPVRRGLVLLILSIAVYLISLDISVVNVAVPALATDLSAATAELQWVLDSYILVFAALVLVAGTVADRYGRRRVLAAGLVVFALGSVGAALARDVEVLIAMRAFQGLGGAMVMPPTLSILSAVFPREERARAIAAWSAASALGLVTGPLVGGWLVDASGWPAIFWVAVPVSSACLLGLTQVPESRDARRRRIDIAGAVLATGAMFSLAFAIIQAPHLGWSSPPILGTFAGAAALSALLLAVELRVRYPMLPLALFRQREFTGAVSAIGLAFFAVGSLGFFMAQYFQLVQGHSALESGVRILPMAIAMAGIAPLSPALAARFGPRAVASAAALVVLAGMLVLLMLDAGGGYSIAFAGVLLIGIGGGMALAPLTDTVMAAVPLNDAGIGSAMNDASRTLGVALGVAVLGSLLSEVYASSLRELLATGVSSEVLEAASDGLAIALVSTANLDAETAGRVTVATREAFVDGLHATLVVGAGMMAGAAVLTFALLPRRMRERQAVEDEGGGSDMERSSREESGTEQVAG